MRLGSQRRVGLGSVALAILCCAASPVLGQRFPLDQPLTLDQAIRLADRSQESLQAAEHRVRQARAARWSAYTVLFPRASVSGTYLRRAFETIREVGGETAVIQRRDGFSSAARGEMTLFDATVFPRIAAANHVLTATKAEAEAVRRELWLEVAESFFSVLSAEQIEQAALHREQVAALHVRSAGRRVEAGLVGRNTLTRAELEQAAAKLEVTRAQNATRTARLSLGFLIGQDTPERLVAPDGPLVNDFPEPRLVERARALRPDVRALQAYVDAAGARADEPWLGFVPRLDASGIYTWTNEAGFLGRNTNWNLAVTATWVAFDGGSRIAAAQERKAERAALQAELDAVRRMVNLEVQLALTHLATAMEALQQADAQVEVAEMNRVEVAARFDRGLSDALVMADATQFEFEATAERSRQQLALRLAEIGVLRSVGDWTEGRP